MTTALKNFDETAATLVFLKRSAKKEVVASMILFVAGIFAFSKNAGKKSVTTHPYYYARKTATHQVSSLDRQVNHGQTSRPYMDH